MGEIEKLRKQLRDAFFRPTQQSLQPSVQEAAASKRPSIRAGTTYTPPPPVVPVAGDTVVTEVTYGQASNAGALASFSREDHTHGSVPVPAPEGHLGCGGGTLVGGVPEYDYEDHNRFNSTWCFWPISGTTLTDAVSGKPNWWFAPYRSGAPAAYMAWPRTNNVPWGYYQNLVTRNVIGNDVCLHRWGNRVGPMMTPDVTHHFMVKGLAYERQATNPSGSGPLSNMNLTIGFWSTYQFLAACYGIGFAWSSAIPASFPNANFYATCNTVPGGIYAVDTGVPIYPFPPVPRKFNVVYGQTVSKFYIDNVLVATITPAAAGLSYPLWTNGDFIQKYAQFSMSTTDAFNWGAMYWKTPFVFAMDHTPIP